MPASKQKQREHAPPRRTVNGSDKELAVPSLNAAWDYLEERRRDDEEAVSLHYGRMVTVDG